MDTDADLGSAATTRLAIRGGATGVDHPVTNYRPWPTSMLEGRATGAVPKRRRERIVALDAARGLAILLVMMSHFAMRFAAEAGRAGELRAAVLIGMIASPTFVLLSGAVYGTLSRSPTIDAKRLRNLLIDRGIFLLLVAHPLLAASNLVRATDGAWHQLYITDTIAPALVLGPLLASRTGRRVRLILGVALVLAGWCVLALPTPATRDALEIIREGLVGTLTHGGETWWGFHWPFVQWFGVYLLGTIIGEEVAVRPAQPWRGSGAEWLLWTGIMAGVAGVAMHLMIAAEFTGPSHTVAVLAHAASITSKFPPAPAYLLWFGGIGLMMIAVMYAPLPPRVGEPLRRIASPLGRSSLVLYVTSDYVFHVPFLFWHPRTLAWWLPTFAALLVPLYWLARRWSAADANRYLTVGYPFRTRLFVWCRVARDRIRPRPAASRGVPEWEDAA